MTNGRPSRTRSCTAPGCPPAVRKTRPSAGSPSGTAMITSIWLRCWPARTAASPACPGNGTRSAPPAWPPSSGTGCAPPHPPTAPRPAVRPVPRTRRPPAVAWTKHPGSRCGGRSPPLPPRPGASTSSSPAWTRPGCWCASGSASRNPGQVTGYSVALPGDTTKDGGPVWYGGGKLAADLSWPKLRQRWTPHRVTPGAAGLTAEERNAVWDHATRAAADAAAQIRSLAWTDPAAAADAAWATSDTLHVAAAVLGSRILRQAADAYDRAARSPYGRIPPPTPAGNQLRQAARLLSAFAYLTGDRSMAPIMLITRLAALAEAVAELRDAQQHAAQAAAARAAAERLYAAARPAPPAQPRPAQRASTAAQLAGLSFPQSAPPTSDTRTARSGSRRTATSATAATTQATRPYPLTMRARTAQTHQICGSSARMPRARPAGASCGTWRAPVAACPTVVASPPRSRCRRYARRDGANRRIATSGSCHPR